MSSPHPPIPEPTGPTGAALSLRVAAWLLGIALVVAAMVWLTLFEIKTIAEDNVATPEETAQCLADLDPASQANPAEACPTEPNVIWAARHPLRNAAIVFVLLLVAGYGAIALNDYVRANS